MEMRKIIGNEDNEELSIRRKLELLDAWQLTIHNNPTLDNVISVFLDVLSNARNDLTKTL